MDLIITMAFSIVMLIFMLFPAMKISEYIASKKEIAQRTKDILTMIFTVILSLLIGLFLKYSSTIL